MFSFRKRLFATFAIFCGVAAVGRAGPYVPAAGFPGATAIAASSASFFEWASGYTIQRGLVEIDQPSGGFATYGGTNGGVATGSPNAAPIGPAPWPPTSQYGIALGQGGTITLTFPDPITNGPARTSQCLGMASRVAAPLRSSSRPSWRSVRTASTSFPFRPFRLRKRPRKSKTSANSIRQTFTTWPARTPPAGERRLTSTKLAGVSPLLNVNHITALRLVDCVDDINPAYASYDSLGNVINAPWPALSSAGGEGFILEGVGVVNAVPKPGSLAL